MDFHRPDSPYIQHWFLKTVYVAPRYPCSEPHLTFATFRALDLIAINESSEVPSTHCSILGKDPRMKKTECALRKFVVIGRKRHNYDGTLQCGLEGKTCSSTVHTTLKNCKGKNQPFRQEGSWRALVGNWRSWEPWTRNGELARNDDIHL